MKITAIIILLFGIASLGAADLRIVPAEPPLEKIRELADSAIIVLLCKPGKDRTGLEVSMVLKGGGSYETIKGRIAEILPESDKTALATDGFRELVFLVPVDAPEKFRCSSSYALWPQRDETLGKQTFRFLAHDMENVKRVIGETGKRLPQESDGDSGKTPE